MNRDYADRWKITDTDVPFSHIVFWYLKMAVPALMFVLLSCIICYFTVDFIAAHQLRSALRKNGIDPDFTSTKHNRGFSDPNYWKP